MSLSKSAIIEKAQKLVLKGKIKQAIAEWKKLAAENPNDGNTYNAIGDLYLKSNDKPNATSAFIKAADAFQEAAFELKSIALYKKALKVDPSKIEIHEKLAAVYAERGLIGNAIDAYLKAAKHYYKTGNFRSALTVYRKLSNLDPENVNIRLEIAEMCEKRDVAEEAIEEYKKIVALYDEKNMPTEADAIRGKISALDPTYASQQTSEAEKASNPLPETALEVEVAQQTEEDAPPAESSAFQEESAQGFLAPEAEPLLQEQTVFPSEQTMLSNPPPGEAPQNNPDQAQLENALTEAEVYVQYGLIDKAIAQLKSLLSTFPLELKPHLKLKEIYTQQGMTQEAIASCRFLLKHYTSLGDETAKKEILQDLSALDSEYGALSDLSAAASHAESPSNVSYFDDETEPETTDHETESFSKVLFQEDSLSDEVSEAPTLAALEEMASDNSLLQEQEKGSDKSGALSEEVLQTRDENLKSGDEEYVDLNSILSEGFGGDEDEIEGSLEKSFRDLQESHEGHDGEERETQYDLGIAYKEMGMISEAMKAFELAAVGQSRFEDATIMLALCYREAGSTPKAAKILEKALSEKENRTGNFIALKYELALLYEKLGDKKCERLYQEIFDADPSFREIAKKYGNLRSKGQQNKQTSAHKKRGTQNKQKTSDQVSYL